MNEVGGAEADSDTAKEFVFTIFNVVNDDSLSQSGCEVVEDGLMVIASGASVNVCPQVVRKIDSSEIRRISSSPMCRRKDTPRLREASNLAEDRKTT